MGQYTEHWARYTQQQNRYTIQLLGLVLLLPAIALLGYGLSYLEGPLPSLLRSLCSGKVPFQLPAVRVAYAPRGTKLNPFQRAVPYRGHAFRSARLRSAA